MLNKQVIWATARALGYSTDKECIGAIRRITDPNGKHVAYVSNGSLPVSLNGYDTVVIAEHMKDKYGVNFTLD